MSEKAIHIRKYSSPCGELVLGACENRLCLCDWLVENRRERIDRRLKRMLRAEIVEQEPGADAEVLDAAEAQLDEYFRGERVAFTIPLWFAGTDFQKQVWEELLSIPYGTTISYGELARRIGRPASVRAVANANGANAISLFVPCHRVIGSDGTPAGYAGGIPAKHHLLSLEKGAVTGEI